MIDRELAKALGFLSFVLPLFVLTLLEFLGVFSDTL